MEILYAAPGRNGYLRPQLSTISSVVQEDSLLFDGGRFPSQQPVHHGTARVERICCSEYPQPALALHTGFHRHHGCDDVCFVSGKVTQSSCKAWLLRGIDDVFGFTAMVDLWVTSWLVFFGQRAYLQRSPRS